MMTTWPASERLRAGRNARVARIVPRTFTSYIQRQSSSDASSMGSRPFAPPALFTRTRQPPTKAAKTSTEARSVTSSLQARPPISSARASRRSMRLAPTTTSKPREASTRAVARPIPEDAPVTAATPRSDPIGAELSRGGYPAERVQRRNGPCRASIDADQGAPGAPLPTEGPRPAGPGLGCRRVDRTRARRAPVRAGAAVRPVWRPVPLPDRGGHDRVDPESAGQAPDCP